MSPSSESLTLPNVAPHRSAVPAPATTHEASKRPVVLSLASCTDPACRCQGCGGLLIVTMGGASQTRLSEHAQSHLGGRCLGALTLAGVQQQSFAQSTQLFYGSRLLASLPLSFRSPTCTAVPLKLQELDSCKLRHEGSAPCLILLLHQPPALTPVEAALSELIPSSAASVAVDREPSGDPFAPAPQLLVHPDGWALGGFLMRAALLRQRSYWQSRDNSQREISQAASQNLEVVATAPRRSFFQQFSFLRGRS